MTGVASPRPVVEKAPAAGVPDVTLLRRALGQFATGVTVITTVGPDGEPAGCTVSAFCALSLDPPLVLVCIDKARAMHQLLTTAPGYVVNVLRADQQDLALRFARPGGDRFSGLSLHHGRHDIPHLGAAIAHLECDRHAVLDGGDHAIILGRVQGLAVHDGEPLLYTRGTFLNLPKAQWDRALADAPPEWLLTAPW
jgi:flavin reductase (DIM6/NTAB) family NADH-FMN oxidoreductase RutF